MGNELNVAVKLHADASQYTAEFTKAGQTAQAFSAQVSGSSGLAAAGVQAVVGQLQSVGPAVSGTAPAVQSLGNTLAGIGDKAAKAGSAATSAFEKTTISAKQTAAAMRGVPAQFTDIITSIQGGQAPLTVLLQQGGQLKDMFGGAGNAARALGTYTLGLINPFTVATAAAAAVGYAYYKAEQEANAFRVALVLSGNAAGTTAGQLQLMATHTGLNVSALTAFASSGAIGAQSLENFTATSVKFEKMTGIAVAESVKHFEELKKAPLEASIKLNEGMNYLTESVYKQIKALMEQGKTVEAGVVAQEAFNKAQQSMSAEIEAHLGPVESAWNSITKAIGNAGKAMTQFVASDGPDLQAQKLRDQIAKYEQSMKTGTYANPEAAKSYLEDLKNRLKNLDGVLWFEKGIADQKAKQADKQSALQKFDQDGLQYLSRSKKELQEIARVREQGLALASREADVDKRAAIQAETDKRV
ncbi:MAG: phage tail length tape measure family protein, partial [Rhodoferax sp.]